MIHSAWSDDEAKRYLTRYKHCGQDMALRVYSSRLIGRESSLVLHGGGNTSVKSVLRDILGAERSVLFVKGSGRDLADIEPEGLPAVDLAQCRALRQLDQLSDEDMVNQLRGNMFDSNAPTPSVETLLHAFLPAKFVDHSHADAIVALTNTSNHLDLLEECFGDEVVLVPYVMPGFALAKFAADRFEETPDLTAMILLKHGLFTFGDSARESYERHIACVRKAEQMLAKLSKHNPASTSPQTVSNCWTAEEVFPLIRGRLALRDEQGALTKRFVFELRANESALEFVNHPNLEKLCATGPLTPDHSIRTKEFPLYLELDKAESLEQVQALIDARLSRYKEKYQQYFAQCSAERGVERTPLDPIPRVLLIPGVGIVGVGTTKKAAGIAADIYEHTAKVKLLVSQFSTYEALPSLDIFDVEYWSLEQAKLKKAVSKPLDGRVALITGGAGAIGRGVAEILRSAGAEVVLGDLPQALEHCSEFQSVALDVRSSDSVRSAIRNVVRQHGGLDILVPCTGIARSGPITDYLDKDAEELFEVNFHGYLRAVREAARVLKEQGVGGHIIIISSKNVLAPGREFSLYSASKAAGHQLGKVAALELAGDQIRVNMITPDGVFASHDKPSGLWQDVGPGRAEAHGIRFDELEEFYRKRNLLGVRITAEDVGRAVLFFASEQTPTTGATLPVDGGLANAFPR